MSHVSSIGKGFPLSSQVAHHHGLFGAIESVSLLLRTLEDSGKRRSRFFWTSGSSCMGMNAELCA